MKVKSIVSFLAFFAFVNLQAQDAHFSMYQSVPSLVNPALVGLAPGNNNQRLTTNYRSQWLKHLEQPAFQTMFAGYDFRICPLQCPPGQVKVFGFGLNLMHDRSGESPLQRSQALAQLSFSFGGKNLLLAGGVEGGLIVHNFGKGTLRFDEQFVNGAYDATVQGESFDKNSFVMEDFGIGVALYKAGTGSTFPFSVGGSIKHITTPAYHFFKQDPEVEASLPIRISVHGRAHLEIKKSKSAMDIRTLFMNQGVYRQYLVGFDGLWYYASSQNKNSRLFNMTGGAAMRRSQYLDSGWRSDALVVTLSFQTDLMRISMSYDLSLSEIQPEQNRGAFELALQYFWEKGNDCLMEFPVGL